MLDGELVGLKFLDRHDDIAANFRLTSMESTRHWRTQVVPDGMQIVGIKCHVRGEYIKRLGFQMMRPLKVQWP